jgi:hypothetical protein
LLCDGKNDRWEPRTLTLNIEATEFCVALGRGELNHDLAGGQGRRRELLDGVLVSFTSCGNDIEGGILTMASALY